MKLKALVNPPCSRSMPDCYYSNWFHHEMCMVDNTCQWKDVHPLVEDYNNQVKTILKVAEIATDRIEK